MMKKLYILVLFMSFSGFLLAQEAMVSGKKFHAPENVNSVKTPTDTLEPGGITNASGFTIYNYTSGGVNVGYVFGTNTKAKAQAQAFTLSQSYFVEEVLLWCGFKYINGTAGDINVSINNLNGTGATSTATVNTAPGTQVGTVALSVTDLDTTNFVSIAYFSPAVWGLF